MIVIRKGGGLGRRALFSEKDIVKEMAAPSTLHSVPKRSRIIDLLCKVISREFTRAEVLKQDPHGNNIDPFHVEDVQASASKAQAREAPLNTVKLFMETIA